MFHLMQYLHFLHRVGQAVTVGQPSARHISGFQVSEQKEICHLPLSSAFSHKLYDSSLGRITTKKGQLLFRWHLPVPQSKELYDNKSYAFTGALVRVWKRFMATDYASFAILGDAVQRSKLLRVKLCLNAKVVPKKNAMAWIFIGSIEGSRN